MRHARQHCLSNRLLASVRCEQWRTPSQPPRRADIQLSGSKLAAESFGFDVVEKLCACRLVAIAGHTEAAQFIKGTTRQHSARSQESVSMYKKPHSTASDACTRMPRKGPLREREEKAIAMFRRRQEIKYIQPSSASQLRMVVVPGLFADSGCTGPAGLLQAFWPSANGLSKFKYPKL